MLHPPAFPAQSSRSGGKALVERLEFDDRGAVVIAHPESDRRCGIIHEHSSYIRGPWEKIVRHLTRLRIEPRDTVCEHGSSPRFTVLVSHHIVRLGPRRRGHPLLEALCFRIEHADTIPAKFAEP